MRKIIYVDSFSVGTFHESFNSSSLKMFTEIFEEVEYYTSKSVRNNTYRILKNIPSNIRYKHILNIGGDNKTGRFLRLFIPIFTNSYILIKSNKSDVVFFNYNALWSFSIVNYLSRILQRKVILMCHGEMEYLTNGVKLNCFSKWALDKFKAEKFKPSESLYFCVLGRSIKDNLLNIVSSHVYSKIISFEHSYIFREDVIRVSFLYKAQVANLRRLTR